MRVFVTASQLDIRDIREKNIPTVSLQYQTQILLLSLPTTKHVTLSVKLLLYPCHFFFSDIVIVMCGVLNLVQGSVHIALINWRNLYLLPL